MLSVSCRNHHRASLVFPVGTFSLCCCKSAVEDMPRSIALLFRHKLGSDASAVCGTLHHAAHDHHSGAQADWPRVVERPGAETKVATCVETDGHCWLTEKADPALNRRHRDNTISTICTGYYTQCLTLSLCTRPMYMLY